VWITTSGEPAPPALLDALDSLDVGNRTWPVAVRIGGPTTRAWNGGVLVADDLLAWAASTGQWDIVAATIAELHARSY
jgi:hypothetical protein